MATWLREIQEAQRVRGLDRDPLAVLVPLLVKTLRTADSLGPGVSVRRMLDKPALSVVVAGQNQGPYVLAWHGTGCGPATLSTQAPRGSAVAAPSVPPSTALDTTP